MTVESSRARVTLLGYALDSSDPGVTDTDVAIRVAEAYDGPHNMTALTAPLCGRWVLVVDDGTAPVLAADVFAQRRVLYGPEGWCSGSELVLTRHAGASFDPDALAFRERVGAKTWPASTTSLLGFRRLLASQVLDLRTGSVTSIPLLRGVAVPEVLDEALDVAASTIAGTLAAAARRSPLVMWLTGGVDSRLVLAGCRHLTDRMRFVTIDNPAVGGSDSDARLAGRLARQLGLDHSVVRSGDAPSPAFAAAAAEHTATSTPLWHANNEAVVAVLPEGAVAVTGHLGELWRGSLLYREPAGGAVDADWFLRGRNQHGEPFAADPVRAWFAAAPDELPLHIRAMWDLDFCSRVAQWAEASDLIWRDFLCPYGTRLGTAAVLAAPPALRNCSTEMFEALCRRLWPEVLDAAVLPKLRFRRRPLHRRVGARVRQLLVS